MKSNQLLTRKMGDFDVCQRTQDGMFNATALLHQWNSANGDKKEINKFFDNNSTKEFIDALIKEENLNTQNSAYLKSRGKYSGGTWMHPILFTDFAMWLNPTFKVKVLKFVTDQLLKYRNDAGDGYINLCSAVCSLVDKTLQQNAIQTVAKALNHIVYGTHESNIRNSKADEVHLKDMYELQSKVTGLINEGFIRDYESLLNYLRILWQKKQPSFLTAKIN